MQAMHQRYSVLTSARNIEAQLTHESNFVAEAAKMQFAFVQLAAVRQPKSEIDKIEALTRAGAYLIGVANATLLYKQMHSSIATQSFDDLVLFVLQQAPNYASLTTGLVAATVNMAPPIVSPANGETTAILIQEILAAVNAAVAKPTKAPSSTSAPSG